MQQNGYLPENTLDVYAISLDIRTLWLWQKGLIVHASGHKLYHDKLHWKEINYTPKQFGMFPCMYLGTTENV